MKELYLPGLRDYVKSNYPLGPVWSPTGKPAADPPKAPAPGAPAPPPPPPASLFSTESSQASSSRPKEGMAAVFQEINSGNSVTAGASFDHTVFALFLFVGILGKCNLGYLHCRSEKGHS